MINKDTNFKCIRFLNPKCVKNCHIALRGFEIILGMILTHKVKIYRNCFMSTYKHIWANMLICGTIHKFIAAPIGIFHTKEHSDNNQFTL